MVTAARTPGGESQQPVGSVTAPLLPGAKPTSLSTTGPIQEAVGTMDEGSMGGGGLMTTVAEGDDIDSAADNERMKVSSAASSESNHSDGDDFRPRSESTSLLNGLLERRYLPPRRKASRQDRIQRSQLCISLLCMGNTTNSSVVLSAFPAAMREALSPHTSFMVLNLLRYIATPKDTLLAATFADKMGAEGAAWYMLFGLLPHTIENPRLVWNAQMLSHLEEVLKGQCDSLDYMRQLR